MFHPLFKALKKPTRYCASDAPFWDDPYISQQMLRAHLDPDHPGASRSPDFIARSVKWINSLCPQYAFPTLLDLGCGPGLYAEPFARLGYHVTGIDLSKRSIDYAVNSAKRQQLSIDYHCENYLFLHSSHLFDLAVMIYCDYGALSTTDRRTLMRNVYAQLRSGGRFLLDVFSMTTYHAFEEGQNWEMSDKNGFWYPYHYIALHSRYLYPPATTLSQTTILTASSSTTYRIWNTCFTPDTLSAEATAAGFICRGIWGDIAGAPYNEALTTLAILLEKP